MSNPAPGNTEDKLSDSRLNELADEFLNDLRAGADVDVEEFASRNIEYEAAIRELFPALIALETARPAYFSDPAESKLGENDFCLPQFNEANVHQLGPYKINGLLGRGGMGVVFLAEHTELSRFVALKILPTLLAEASELRDRFLQEATAMAQMQHPNIVQLYESGVGEVNNTPEFQLHYLAIQYVPGKSLDKLLSQSVSKDKNLKSDIGQTETIGLEKSSTVSNQDRIPQTQAADQCQNSQLMAMSNKKRWNQIAEIGIEVASALSHSHEKEILHRDIKPSNLILDPDGKVWVTDFGLAKFMVNEATATNGIVGTLRFMPPERFRGWADPRSDIYSLGATLYELATLQKAYPENDRSLLISKIIESSPIAPGAQVQAIPRDLETIILTCMNREPAHRYQTAEALAEDLQRFNDGLPIRVRRVGHWSQFKSWVRRNPLVATLTLMIVFLFIAIGIGSLIASIQFGALANQMRIQKDSAQNSLLLAYENEANSYTLSGRVGQRTKSLAAIQNGVDLLPKVEHSDKDILQLRNSCIAAITLTDLELESEYPVGSNKAALSPNGQFYAWSDNNRRLFLHHAKTGNQIWSFQFQSPLKNFYVLPFFSPDSRYLFGYSDSIDRLRLFDVRNGKVLLALENSPLDVDSPVAFSGDGKWMAVPNRSQPIRIFDLANLDKPPKEISVPFPINQLVFVDDDKRLLGYYMRRGSGDLFSYDFAAAKSEVFKTGLPDISTVRRIENRGLLVSYGGGHVCMLHWPPNNRYQYRAQVGSTVGSVNTSNGLVCVNPWGSDCQILDSSNGRTLLRVWGSSSGFADQGNRLALTSESTLKIFRVQSHEPYLRSVAFGDESHDFFSPQVEPTGKFLLKVGYTSNEIYDPESLKLRTSRIEPNFGGGSRFLEDGRIVSVINGHLTVFAINKTGERLEFSERMNLSRAHIQGCIAAPTKGSRIAWRMPTGKIRIASIDDLDRHIEIELDTRGTIFIPLFAMTPNGDKLVVADGTLRVFDVTTGKELHDFGQESQLFSRSNFGFSPDGTRVVCHSGHDLMLFDLEKYTLEQRFPSQSYRGGAAWSPNGKLLATVHDTETIMIRDGNSYEEIARLRAPKSKGIESIRFSANGDAIFAALERNIYRWDLKEIRVKLREYGLDWD